VYDILLLLLLQGGARPLVTMSTTTTLLILNFTCQLNLKTNKNNYDHLRERMPNYVLFFGTVFSLGIGWMELAKHWYAYTK
jgi:hypothetical protein